MKDKGSTYTAKGLRLVFSSLLVAHCSWLFAFPALAQWSDQGTITFLKESRFVTLESRGLSGVKRAKMLYVDAAHPLFIRVTDVPVLDLEVRRAFHPDFPETSRPMVLTIYEGKVVTERRNLSAEKDFFSRFLETDMVAPSQRDNFTISPPMGVSTYYFALPRDFKGGAVIYLGRPLGDKQLAEIDILPRGAEDTAPREASRPAAEEIPKRAQPSAVSQAAPALEAAGPGINAVPAWRAPSFRRESRARLGLGLSVNYLFSLGPGDRYLTAPAFLLEAMLKIPLHSNWLVPTESNSVSFGVEGGYYFSSGSRTSADDVRGEYRVTWDLQVIPIYFNVFYGIPVTPRLGISLGAGAGVSICGLKPSYDTDLGGDEYGSMSGNSFGYQFIGRGLYRTGTFGEVIFELKQNQAGFSSGGHPESQGDIGGLSLGVGYTYFIF